MENTEKVIFEGEKYTLNIEATFHTKAWTETRVMTRSHYLDGCEYDVNLYIEYFEGKGTLLNNHDPAEKFFFKVNTPVVKEKEGKSLEQKILGMETETNKVVNPKQFADILCEAVLLELKAQKEKEEEVALNGFSITFKDNWMNKDHLIRRGVLATEDLQINIAL